LGFIHGWFLPPDCATAEGSTVRIEMESEKIRQNLSVDGIRRGMSNLQFLYKIVIVAGAPNFAEFFDPGHRRRYSPSLGNACIRALH
jgi:hypothetical protein